MNRTEITAGLSELLRKRLKNECRRFAEEVTFYNPLIRVDFVAFKPGRNGIFSVGGVETGVTSFYEVKSCMADFKSGNGLNFHGDENWLVAPTELVNALAGESFLNCGVYVPVPKGSSVMREMESPTPYSGEVDGWSLHVRDSIAYPTSREYSLTQILAAMIFARGIKGG